jgi:hypothetical protein
MCGNARALRGNGLLISEAKEGIMSEPAAGEPPSKADLQANLTSLARQLRTAHHLGPEAQQRLAELLSELSVAVGASPLPSVETRSLASHTGELVEALKNEADASALGEAKAKFDRAVLKAEVKAPFAAGIARRVVDVLTDLGI